MLDVMLDVTGRGLSGRGGGYQQLGRTRGLEFWTRILDCVGFGGPPC